MISLLALYTFSRLLLPNSSLQSRSPELRLPVETCAFTQAILHTDTLRSKVEATEGYGPTGKIHIKEIAKARRQRKPEKLDENKNEQDTISRKRIQRIRRPAGLDRPPEIPRMNGN